jgi:dimethylargininase
MTCSEQKGYIMIAITRVPGPNLASCELTHLDRVPVDISKATVQHRTYELQLERFGCEIHRLPETPELPDAVFVEDVAVVFPEIAIITRPGAASRRAETDSMAAELRKWRPLKWITTPGTIDGGDILTIGKRVWIGQSGRSNREGILQFQEYLKPFGYTVAGVPVSGCLHLKTALAPVEEDLMLMNPNWADPGDFPGITCIPVHPEEPFGANLLRFGAFVLCSTDFPHTMEWIENYGLHPVAIDYSELAKAEAGLTCCSVIFS